MKTDVDRPTPPPATPEKPDLRRRKLLLPLSAIGQDQPEPEAPPTPIAPYRVLANEIRRHSATGVVVNSRTLWAAEEDEMRTTLLTQLQADPACQDIQHIPHGDTCFYYSEQHMSHNYARILVFTHEQDTCATLAQSVRFECETYPRPFKVSMLALPPYRFDEDQIASALRFLAQSAEYGDIHPVTASNGAAYLYSDHFMSAGKAQGLCEWIEVEQYENP